MLPLVRLMYHVIHHLRNALVCPAFLRTPPILPNAIAAAKWLLTAYCGGFLPCCLIFLSSVLRRSATGWLMTSHLLFANSRCHSGGYAYISIFYLLWFRTLYVYCPSSVLVREHQVTFHSCNAVMASPKQTLFAACILCVLCLIVWLSFNEHTLNVVLETINQQHSSPYKNDERKSNQEPAKDEMDKTVISGASKLYTPMRMRDCTSTMPAHFAPCLALSLDNAVEGEELLYSAFTLSEPIFAMSRPNDGAKWGDMAQDILMDRAHRLENSLLYREQHGQTIVR